MADANPREEAFFKQAGSIVAAVYREVFKDGTLDAAFRQGADELGQALKAFPDAIQANESGTVLNPLHSTIAGEMERMSGPAEGAGEARTLSPSEIIRGNTPAAAEPGPARQPSPSDIVRDSRNASPAAEADQQREQDRGNDQSNGRG